MRSPHRPALVPVLPLLLSLAGCPRPADELPEELTVSGSLDRDSVTSSNSVTVPIQFRSEGARGDWWPCDLRLTALGCVGDAHVNVYVALPTVTSLDGLGRGDCVTDGEPNGVYEELQRRGGPGTYSVGQDVSVFVVVASDKDASPGADIANDDETRAATRLESGALRIDRWAGFSALGLAIDGVTVEGREVHIEFSGPTTSGDVIPLEGPETCVEGALLET